MPEDLPCEDIRHALYKFESIVEVVRLYVNPSSLQQFQHHYQSSHQSQTSESTSSQAAGEGNSKSNRKKGEKPIKLQEIFEINLFSWHQIVNGICRRESDHLGTWRSQRKFSIIVQCH